VALEASGSDTKLTYDADASVGGRIASVGQRLLEASAKAVIKQSLEALHETVKARAQQARSSPPAAPAPAHTTDEPEEPSPPSAPLAPIVPQPINQAKLAAAVAKEVTKSLIPPAALWALAAIALLVVIWFFSRPR
jgi:uncharacterized protein